MEDALDDEIEFRQFMTEINELQEEIFWKHQNLTFQTAKVAFDDIVVYGKEPVFAALIFERMLDEAKSES